ncbi:GNAT family N-acetyltransferase [Mycobacterium hubeiense]|uniref:GNAT family N-acetyltransferase n=1 Tax=Mycobacterium hubeiense TaxID=1867256 RepID=UPI000C7E952F|nr:GNAT family N-acetyltransferase [Mycobacterium sp. QGD 101]
MDVRLHRSFDEFRAIAQPLYRREPVAHTVELTALRSPPPSDTGDNAVLLTAWNNGVAIGAAMQAPPFPLLCNGIPVEAAPAAASELSPVRPALLGVRGERARATAFADAWCDATGHTATLAAEERLYRLATLRAPGRVAGEYRQVGDDDRRLVVDWLDAFFAETDGGPSDPAARGRFIDTANQLGDRLLLWIADGVPVSLAMVRAPVAGVSRVGPVFTPHELRGHGYGSAVTAAAAELALRSGVAEVVLFADLANPVSNAIYQRIGFEAVGDSVRYGFRVR